jgi:hypothetical protein
MQIPSCVLGIALHKKYKHTFCTVFADGILNKKFILNAATPKILANIYRPSNIDISNALCSLHVAFLGVRMIIFLLL